MVKKKRKIDRVWQEQMAYSLVVLVLLSSVVLIGAIRIESLRQTQVRRRLTRSYQIKPSYWSFSSGNGFSVDYPSEWQRIGQGLPPGFLLAVFDNSGAQVGIIEDSLVGRGSLNQVLRERVDNFSSLGKVEILNQTNDSNSALIEFTVGLSNGPIHSWAKAVKSERPNKFYVVMVSAPVSSLDRYQSIIDHILNSIKTAS